MGGILWAASAANGEKLAQYSSTPRPPGTAWPPPTACSSFSLADGRVLCMAPPRNPAADQPEPQRR